MVKLKNIKMKPKLTGVLLVLGIIPLLLVGWWSSKLATDALIKKSFDQLIGSREVKKIQMEKFINKSKVDLDILSETVVTIREESIEKITNIAEYKTKIIKKWLQDRMDDIHIVSLTPFYNEAVQTIMHGSEDESKRVENEILHEFETNQKIHGYYNEMKILDMEGNHLVSLKGLDKNEAGQSWFTGALAAAKTSVKDGSCKDLYISTIEHCNELNLPSIHIAHVIRDRKTFDPIAVIAVDCNIDKFMQIIADNSGLGETGKTYLVGSDYIMRSNLQSDGEQTIFTKKIETIGVKDVFARHDMKLGDRTLTYIGHEGKSVFGHNQYLKELDIAVITEIDVTEIYCPKTENDNFLLAKFKELNNYYDLFLINPDGLIFYSVGKESDFETNLVTGTYSNSNLGKLFRKVMETKQFSLTDFEPYAPSNNEPAAFSANAIIHKDKVGLVIALQLSPELINNIMQERAGMGKTEEAYLVGPDKLMRSDSFLNPTDYSVKASFANKSTGTVDTDAIRKSLSGLTGEEILIDYNGYSVLSAFAPLKVGDITWAIVAEINEAEVKEPINQLLISILIAGIIVIILVIFFAFIIARNIANPLVQSVELTNLIAQGDLTAEIKVNQKDEAGMMADSLKEMSLKLRDVVTQIKTASDNVAQGSQELSSSSEALSQGANEQAASLEEISSTMVEIDGQSRSNAENASNLNRNVGELKEMAETGMEKMKDMKFAMKEIEQASKSISKIIDVIDDVASQTNLLALNATIEAASAGEAGRGFAVVANEIKELANQSARAVKETAELIESSIKKVEKGGEITNQTAEALKQIVLGAVQGAEMTAEIAASASEQTQAIVQVSQALEQVDQVTQANTATSEETAAAAEELNAQGEQLQQILTKFKLTRQDTM